ncbi:MAG TPA: peptide chain release factor 1 [Cryomorphaceae bacterium]|nr:peptide chain release factor 1 [Cryomorphaceae bacterium]HBB80791.1 peptide chain release factor 1 [Cryomorphaceae bacterium]HCY24788.1 peptide chain release factor 1 [Cryomorphaceae bacterium]|tara:strand:+ start:2553 stop:3629 length:1077 start_codon:yes stop_codon:yes gene_type:complete
MLDKLNVILQRFNEVTDLIIQPDVINDNQRYVSLNREYKSLKPLVEIREKYIELSSRINEAKLVLKEEKDPDFREMAKMELDELLPMFVSLEEEVKVLLLPKDPADDKNALVEIRQGAGGDEGAIFAGDLFRMYQRYCEQRKWKIEIITMNDGTAGGFKEVSFEVTGESVYGILKYESGVHRVQRVPATESQGRVHTSAASVVVLPEAEEVDVDLDMKDVKKDTYRSQGAGGQHVNKTESAVRLTHLPTGIVVECQDGRSQHKNYEQALKVLRSRMFDMEFKKKQAEQAAQRKTMVSTGDRSAKIRTYNYPQGRVTDHRIGLTTYNLTDVIGGDIQRFIDELHMAENAEKMKEGNDII